MANNLHTAEGRDSQVAAWLRNLSALDNIIKVE